MTDKEINDLYYSKMKKFEDSGVVREVYSDEYISVYNVSNAFYIGSIRQVYNDSPIAYMFGKKNLKNILKGGPQAFLDFYNYVHKKNLVSEYGVYVDNKFLEEALRLKSETDLKGPLKNIDLELEEKLMQKNRKR